MTEVLIKGYTGEGEYHMSRHEEKSATHKPSSETT
jgi:hypothetical protein